MVRFLDAPEKSAAEDARKSFAKGHKIFVYQAVILGGANKPRPLDDHAAQVEAIESCGWRLEHMSYSHGNVGYFLFRRPPLQEGI